MLLELFDEVFHRSTDVGNTSVDVDLVHSPWL